METAVQFHLEDFEGPLDLLLTLVTKNKMSIYEIEIVTLIDQYLEVMGTLTPEALESASEFIGMAARLVQMKSYLLLPKSDEAERLKEELTGLLVEYSACKQVAAVLGEMAKGVHIAVRTPVEVEFDTAYTGVHVVAELTSAFTVLMGRSLARRVPRQEQFDEIVAAPIVSVASRVVHVLRGLATGKITGLRQLFRPQDSRGELVATFLAILELVRAGRVSINDDESMLLHKGKVRKMQPPGEEA